MPEGIRGQPLRYSRFHCRELLYDYMNGRLDSERHKAVEAGLIEFPELKNELAAMLSAVHYCAELAKIKPQENLVQDFQKIRLKTEIVSEKVKYKNWPDLLRWSSEAVVISVFVAAVGWLIPWSSFQDIFKIEPNNEIVLADIDAKTKTDVVVPPLEKNADENNDEKPVEVPAQASNLKSEAAKEAGKVVTQITASEELAPAPVVKAPEKVPVQAATPQPAPAPKKKKGPQGFLYRIMMNVAGIQTSAPILRDQIIALGGEKAGQVEIGHRQTNGNYFHFSMPESNYQALLKTLGTYGPVRIYKGPHDRVMPDGVIRIILDIQDVKGKAAPKAAPPVTPPATGSATENETSGSTAEPIESAPSVEEEPSTVDTSSDGQ